LNSAKDRTGQQGGTERHPDDRQGAGDDQRGKQYTGPGERCDHHPLTYDRPIVKVPRSLEEQRRQENVQSRVTERVREPPRRDKSVRDAQSNQDDKLPEFHAA
jgi:hypothetical protein